MSQRKSKAPVGYVLRKFPVLSETFVLNEILALEAQGVPVHIYAIQRPNDPCFHEDLAKLQARINYIPQIGNLKWLLRRNWQLAKRAPKAYLRTLGYALIKLRPILIWRFLQAGMVAVDARGKGIQHFHAHFAGSATTVTSMASKLSGIPYSFTAHAVDIYKNRVSTRVLARKMSGADFVITISDVNRDYLSGFANGSASKIVIVRNGIDLLRFVPNGAGPHTPFTLLCVARLIEKKGHAVLIDACRRLRDRGHSFQCLIVGQGILGRRIRDLIQQAGLQDEVHLLGPKKQGEILDLYHSSDLFVLPCQVTADGNRDGLPVSIVEALACGLPVVSTPVTGIPEAVKHGENGLLMPAGDPESLADGIESLMHDREIYERFRAAAHRSVQTQFDIQATAGQLSQLFERPRA